MNLENLKNIEIKEAPVSPASLIILFLFYPDSQQHDKGKNDD
jgi:hypothetical protein